MRTVYICVVDIEQVQVLSPDKNMYLRFAMLTMYSWQADNILQGYLMRVSL